MASRVRLSGAARRPRPQARQSRVSDHLPYEQQLLVSSLMINRKVLLSIKIRRKKWNFLNHKEALELEAVESTLWHNCKTIGNILAMFVYQGFGQQTSSLDLEFKVLKLSLSWEFETLFIGLPVTFVSEVIGYELCIRGDYGVSHIGDMVMKQQFCFHDNVFV